MNVGDKVIFRVIGNRVGYGLGEITGRRGNGFKLKVFDRNREAFRSMNRGVSWDASEFVAVFPAERCANRTIEDWRHTAVHLAVLARKAELELKKLDAAYREQAMVIGLTEGAIRPPLATR